MPAVIGSQGLKTGDISLVIGTHSLIADKVEFSSLRIAVIDEQHRFGVIQRGLFNSKVIYERSTYLSILLHYDAFLTSEIVKILAERMLSRS